MQNPFVPRVVAHLKPFLNKGVGNLGLRTKMASIKKVYEEQEGITHNLPGTIQGIISPDYTRWQWDDRTRILDESFQPIADACQHLVRGVLDNSVVRRLDLRCRHSEDVWRGLRWLSTWSTWPT